MPLCLCCALQRVSLVDPSVHGSRKYVSQVREPSDPLAPGHKFGFWGARSGPVLDPTSMAIKFADSLTDAELLEMPQNEAVPSFEDVAAGSESLDMSASMLDGLATGR